MGIDGIKQKQKNSKLEGREWIFGRELNRPTMNGKDFWFFAGGSFTLLFILFFLGSIDAAVTASKQILGTTTVGIEFLKNGNFGEAQVNFTKAKKQLSDSSDVLLKIVNSLPLGRDVDAIFSASSDVIDALQFLNQGSQEFLNTKIIWDQEQNSSDQAFYNSLKISREYLVASQAKLDKALALLNTVNLDVLPSEFRRQFFEVRDQIGLGRRSLAETDFLEAFLLGLLGGEKKTYLLIFQNNNEARATGGFIGTYGILIFENGKMKIDRIESIYNIDGRLSRKIAAPGPLQEKVSELWALRDANWFVDFPASARKIIEFVELEGGVGLVDGVISFTPDVFERLLKLTGPIEMPEYGEVLSSENFREVVQYKTSVDYDRTINQPKKFLADFAPRLLQKLGNLGQEKILDLANQMLKLISEKHILMFSLDSDSQKNIADIGAAGEIKQTDGDYLAIFHSNIGGGKTDVRISQKVEKKVVVASGGLTVTKLKITRTHGGGSEKYFPKNVDFMRVLVPRQAKLLSAAGFGEFELLPSTREGAFTDSDLAVWDSHMTRDENTGIYVGEESGYTVFAGLLELDPGMTKTVELTYEVPFFSGKNYTHLLQKQAGAQPFEHSLGINYMAGNIVYFYPEILGRRGNELSLSEIVNSDRFYGLIGE